MPASAPKLASLAGTAFTYQGQLKKDSVPVNGNCNVQFGLFADASATNRVAGPVSGSPNPVSVTNGPFAVQVDFGSGAITGDARWRRRMDVAVWISAAWLTRGSATSACLNSA